jgi:hypothetical protein
MRRKLIVGLAVLNGMLAVALFAVPASTQIIPLGIFNCCENAGTPEGYCCQNCCWFIPNCTNDGQCQGPD